jgi:hypothetical protein
MRLIRKDVKAAGSNLCLIRNYSLKLVVFKLTLPESSARKSAFSSMTPPLEVLHRRSQ